MDFCFDSGRVSGCHGSGLILSLLGAGWKEGRLTPVLLRIDRIPTEVALGIYMIAGTIFLIYFFSIKSWGTVLYGITVILRAVLAGSYLIFLSGCLSLARRIKCRTLWSNSVCGAGKDMAAGSFCQNDFRTCASGLCYIFCPEFSVSSLLQKKPE